MRQRITSINNDCSYEVVKVYNAIYLLQSKIMKVSLGRKYLININSHRHTTYNYVKYSYLIKNFFINIKKLNNSTLPIIINNISEIFEVIFIPEK